MLRGRINLIQRILYFLYNYGSAPVLYNNKSCATDLKKSDMVFNLLFRKNAEYRFASLPDGF